MGAINERLYLKHVEKTPEERKAVYIKLMKELGKLICDDVDPGMCSGIVRHVEGGTLCRYHERKRSED